jgi:hypothetical protein
MTITQFVFKSCVVCVWLFRKASIINVLLFNCFLIVRKHSNGRKERGEKIIILMM